MARAALGTALELRLRARAEHSDAAGSSAPVPRKIDTDTMLADNCLPDSFIERPSTLRFIENINADAVDHLPARKTMGGPMLTKYAAEVTAEEDEHVRDKQNSTGGRDAVKLPTTKVTGLENISDIAEYYCKKLLRCDSDTLVGEISDWLSGKFVKKEKTLDQFQKLFVATASCVLRSYAAYQANEHPTKASASNILDHGKYRYL
ncbi:hypothetical protein JG687_00008624 [Phytophthora cactorum]|uniref:Uncharacterized protein n=1 Tax=Phytophthora cactorum TaxID=29920 RepID=A0A8T1UEA8_9STRA|nr:hypothetical protein JG687_00008624 [Phytophthora cactorum]